MRFITEFKCDDSAWDANLAILKHRKSCREDEIGNMIAESFGWQNPVNEDSLHYRLEIEAFPMDKWIEFKERILNMKLYYPSDIQVIEQYLKDLESFSKPEHEQSKTTK